MTNEEIKAKLNRKTKTKQSKTQAEELTLEQKLADHRVRFADSGAPITQFDDFTLWAAAVKMRDLQMIFGEPLQKQLPLLAIVDLLIAARQRDELKNAVTSLRNI
jgi:hypothetical protein